MNKLMTMTMCAAMAATNVMAEEFGSSNNGAETLPSEAVLSEQATMESAMVPVSTASADDQLKAFVEDIRTNEKNPAYDPDYVIDQKDRKRNRFIVSEKIGFTIRSQEVGEKYLELRDGMMSLLLLKAKVKLARLRTGRVDAKKASVDDDDTTTLTRELARLAELELVGTTVLEQFESCQEEDGMYKCQIAILMSWSKESENVAKAIQLAFSNPRQAPILLKPGKNSVGGWAGKKARQGALGDWLGPRRYVDKDGVVWFVGIAAAPYEKNERRNDQRGDEARLLAEAEVAWSLFGDVKMTNVIVKTMSLLNGKDLEDMTDDEKANFGRQFVKVMRDETSMETAGMAYPYEGVLKDASGQKINVCVAAISLQSKRDALQDLRDMEDTARAVKAGRAAERAGRENKIGNPKPVVKTPSTGPQGSQGEVKKVKPAAAGRLGTGVRHFSNDDE